MCPVIALTGATGFVGGRIAMELARRGWPVRALTRRPPPAEVAALPDIEWIRGHLQDGDALERLLAGADALVHCAGLVKARTARVFDEVNARSVARLAELAVRKGPTRFVLISSLAAREPGLSDYARSKHAGEQALLAHRSALEPTIIRPTAVYGPGDRETLTVFRAVKRGFAPVPGDGSGRISLIHVDDLAAAVAAVLDSPETIGHIFEVDDGRPRGYDFREMLGLMAEALEVRVRPVSVPGLVLKLAGAINQGTALIAGYAPMLTIGKARELCHPDWLCRDRGLVERTAWRPRIAAPEGFRETAGWYRAHGLL